MCANTMAPKLHLPAPYCPKSAQTREDFPAFDQGQTPSGSLECRLPGKSSDWLYFPGLAWLVLSEHARRLPRHRRLNLFTKLSH